MKYVIVKDNNGNVIEKDVYSGDDSEIILGLNSIVVDQLTFDATMVVPKLTDDQIAWQTAKANGTDVALSYIGKKLGLE